MTLRWKKSLGQHLLHDKNILRKIAGSLELSDGEQVVEIGPGSGALTEFLAGPKVRVTAVEVDSQFFEILEDKFGSDERSFKLVKGSVLDVDFDEVAEKNGKTAVAGNLPYNLTSQILFRLFDERERFSRIVVMVQKEVAQRVAAAPSTKERGILAVVCQFHADTQLLFTVSRNCFFPKPKVDSAVVILRLKPLPEGVDPKFFFKVVKTCFGKRRKTLRNSISSVEGIDLKKLEELFDLNRRPEEFELSEWIELVRSIT